MHSKLKYGVYGGGGPVSKFGDLNINGAVITSLFTFKQQKPTKEEPGPAWVLGKMLPSRAPHAHLLSCEYKEVVNLVVSSSFPSSSFRFSSNFNLYKKKNQRN